MGFGPSPIIELIHYGFGALILLSEVVGLIVCFRSLQLSFWVKTVALGFALLVLSNVGIWTSQMVMRLGGIEVMSQQPVFLVGVLGQGAGWPLVVLGLAATFHDVRQRLERYRIEIHRLSGDQPPPAR
jgi:hypothetical protein